MTVTSILSVVLCFIIVGVMLLAMFNNYKVYKFSAYWVVSLLGAVVLLAINYNKVGDILAGLITNTAINPLKILIFFLSMTIMSLVLDKLKFFQFLANKSAKLAKNSQWKLFFIFYAIVSILTIFTSNDIVILSFVPFICYFCKNHKINPTPYVFSTFVAANTWSMLFIIGNPTNVYIGTFANLTFIEYLLNMAIPTLVVGVTSLILLVVLFRKFLSKPINNNENEEVVIDRPLVIYNVSLLLSCIVLLAISSYINLEMWIIALIFAVFQLLSNWFIALFRKREKNYIKGAIINAPWAFVPFLISMFLIINTLNVTGVIEQVAFIFGGNSPFIYGVGSFFACNVINNIPMTTLFASILGNTTYTYQAIYSVIVGSNLGAILSPVGALAGIMFLNILREKDVEFGVKTFIKYGSIISIVCIVVASCVVKLII